MRNYIEVKHEYVDAKGDTNVDVFWAVRPSSASWVIGGREAHVFPDHWRIVEQHIYTIDDIGGLRKLLDAIEGELENDK